MLFWAVVALVGVVVLALSFVIFVYNLGRGVGLALDLSEGVNHLPPHFLTFQRGISVGEFDQGGVIKVDHTL